MRFLKKHALLFIVFLTGAAVLVIEVTATRILSPFYGSTIYTISSVIGVILGALSLGYYAGGRFADRRPSPRWFYGIIAASGLSVFLLEFLVILFLEMYGYSFSLISGPLIFSLVLFFLPSFLLGTLSPFAIKLQEMKYGREGIGRITGEIFFWSTFGSIFGSLFAGFVLIPRFGIREIIVSTGVLLLLIGLAGLARSGFPRRRLPQILLVAVFMAGALFSAWGAFETSADYLWSEDGVYQRITVFDGDYRGRPTRFFKQDASYSSGMFLDSPELAFDYSKYYVLYKIMKPDLARALVLGGAAYSLPKALLADSPNTEVDVVEIEPGAFELAKRFFRVPDDPRLKNYVEDGRRFLYDSQKKYDLIFHDANALYSLPVHLSTEEFFKIVRERLNDEGVFMVNFLGDIDPDPPSLILSQIRTFRAVFPRSYFFAVESPASLKIQNFVFVGSRSDREVNFESSAMRSDPNETIKGAASHLIDLKRYDFSRYTLLTDNYAPVEYMISKILRRNAAAKKTEISSPGKIIRIGGRTLEVAVADDNAERTQGLSGRESLEEGEGMLFLFDSAGTYGFWMREMNFPIDIIWASGDRVVGFSENVKPEPEVPLEKLTVYYPPAPADKVLEVSAGLVQKYGFKIGERIVVE